MEVRDWLAPDQRQGLETLFIEGRLKTDGALFERLDRQMVHEPDNFAALDLDRHRLSLGDADYTRFAAAQKAIAEGRIDPDLARYDRLRLGIDGALGAMGVDTDSPVATKIRAAARDQLESFEVIEGRPPNGRDVDNIVRRAAGHCISRRVCAFSNSSRLRSTSSFGGRHLLGSRRQRLRRVSRWIGSRCNARYRVD